MPTNRFFQRNTLLLLCVCTLLPRARAADWSLSDNPQLAEYFERRVSEIEQDSDLRKYRTLEQWEAAKPKLRGQLFEMLGLKVLPQKSDLKPTITGIVEHDEIRVEKLHFQSLPGLYVTANFYLPKKIDGPLPTVLYVCGHARVKENGVSFGNKTGYQHHGAWFARNGYACLTIDTIQLGEIEGVHHGTYRHNRWWWNARGYTPAGVEAWNCIRALDYLETRSEVDANRFGVTGRSGGGAYSWWIAAIDERIKCAVPVAGIATLRNHVIDGCVEGHCDCMFMVNKHKWDYATVAALVAPRPLLISNTDKDRIFPLDGVVEIHGQVRHIYDLYEEPRQLGLHITEGPHKDTQELRVHAFRWMNRFLKNDEELLRIPAEKLFEPKQLKVFETLPEDEIVTRVDETFVRTSPIPDSRDVDAKLREVFPMPETDSSFEIDNDAKPMASYRQVVKFDSVDGMKLRADVSWKSGSASSFAEALRQSKSVDLFVVDSIKESQRSESDSDLTVIFSPTGHGPHAWNADDRKLIHIRRRFAMVGTTWDEVCLRDIRQLMRLLQSQCGTDTKIRIHASGRLGWLTLLAAVLEPKRSNSIDRLVLAGLKEREEVPVWKLGGLGLELHLVPLAARRTTLELVQPGSELREFIEKHSNTLGRRVTIIGE